MVEHERRTFNDVHNFDVPCLAPCRKDTILVVIGRFNGNNVLECRELRGERQKERNEFWGSEDDREVCMVDAICTCVKPPIVRAEDRLTRILIGKLEPWRKRLRAQHVPTDSAPSVS